MCKVFRWIQYNKQKGTDRSTSRQQLVQVCQFLKCVNLLSWSLSIFEDFQKMVTQRYIGEF